MTEKDDDGQTLFLLIILAALAYVYLKQQEAQKQQVQSQLNYQQMLAAQSQGPQYKVRGAADATIL